MIQRSSPYHRTRRGIARKISDNVKRRQKDSFVKPYNASFVEHGAKIVLDRKRLGNRIGRNATLLSETWNKERYSEELLQVKKRLVKKEINKEQIDRLRAWARIVNIGRTIQLLNLKKGETRRPNVLEVLGVIMQQYGIDSPEMLRAANMMNTALISKKSSVFWDGSPALYAQAIRMTVSKHDRNGNAKKIPLLKFIQGQLTRVKVMDNLEIARAAGMLETKSDIQNTAMQLLEAAGYIVKMPSKLVPGRRVPIGVWTMAGRPLPRIEYKNLEIEVLNRIYFNGDITQRDLYDYRQPPSGTWNKFQFDDNTTKVGIERLINTGLILMVDSKGKYKGKPSTAGRVFQFTERGERLMKTYHRAGYLSEELRELIF